MTGVPEWMSVNPGRDLREAVERRATEQPPAPPPDRRAFIGGSDVAAILGLSPWRTAVDVYFAKTLGEPEITDPGRLRVLRRGKRLEPYVLAMLEEEQPGLTVSARNRRYTDPDVPYFQAEVDYEWLGIFRGANVDDLEEPDTLVANVPQNGELKTVHPFRAREWGAADTDEVPIHYAAQAMWGLGVTRREVAIVSALFGADNLVHYRVLRDDDTIEGMRQKAERFWQEHVLAGVPPPPQTLADLGKLWPRDTGATIEASPELAAHVTSFFSLRDRARTYKDARDAIEILIGEAMKDATTLTYQGEVLCTRKVQERTTIDADKLKALAPGIARQVENKSEFRVIRRKNERTR